MKICMSLKTKANVLLCPCTSSCLFRTACLSSSQPIKLLWSRFLGLELFHFLLCYIFCISPLSHLSSRCSNLFTSGSDFPSHMVMFTPLDLLLLKFFFISYICYIGRVWSRADICSSTQTLMVSLIEPLFCDRYFAKHLTHNNVPLRSPYTNSLRRVSLHPHLEWEHGGPPRLGNLSKDTLSERVCSFGCGGESLGKGRLWTQLSLPPGPKHFFTFHPTRAERHFTFCIGTHTSGLSICSLLFA